MSEGKFMPRDLFEVLAAATVIFAFGIWEHMPNIVPSHYSDITSIFWREGVGRGSHLIPYYQFTFEYPVIVGILVYVCSSVRAFIPDFSLAMAYYTLFMSLSLYFFAVGTIIALYKVLELVKGDKSRIWKCFLIMPSFIMFTVYNWDIIAVFFMVLSLYFFLKGRAWKAYVALGLGVASKVYPIMLLPVYVLEAAKWKERLSSPLITFGVFLLLNSPFMALNFDGWFQTWTYHASWGIEDSWLIFIFDQMDPKAHYVAFAVLIYLVYKGLLESSKKVYGSKAERVIERSFLMCIAWLFGNYVVTPQMALMLLPFYVLIPSLPLALIYASDILNALIIVLWFTPELNFGNPLIASSPVQWAAAARQAIWLSFFLSLLFQKQVRTFFRTLFKRVEE